MFLKKSSIDLIASELSVQMMRVENPSQFEHQENAQSVITNLVEAANILDQIGFEKEASVITELLHRTAWHVPPQHSPTSEQMVHNLEEHGTVLEAPPADFVPNGALHGDKANSAPKKKVEDSNDATAIEVTDEDAVDDKSNDDKKDDADQDSDKNEAADGEILEVEDPENDDDKSWHHEDASNVPGKKSKK